MRQISRIISYQGSILYYIQFNLLEHSVILVITVRDDEEVCIYTYYLECAGIRGVRGIGAPV